MNAAQVDALVAEVTVLGTSQVAMLVTAAPAVVHIAALTALAAAIDLLCNCRSHLAPNTCNLKSGQMLTSSWQVINSVWRTWRLPIEHWWLSSA